MAIRIGIDVGGTFTDAVAVDDATYELIGMVKVPTTHTAPEGVAAGIVQALEKILSDRGINPADVSFIAHGTTQATNALLEGDVEKVGVVGLGRGVEGLKVKMDTAVDRIELAPSKFLDSIHAYVAQDAGLDAGLDSAAEAMRRGGVGVAVVGAAYSVDDPSEEEYARQRLAAKNLIVTCTHEISKLYGLRTRTRTAVINASILPRMMQTARMTEESVVKANIKAPLMIMRCDGGVMSVKEISRRPVLTLLSGPAAGVAGALMYENISEGIFLEVGGTSTDISVIHRGHVMLNYAEVGGHKTYVNSLDIRTVGIAGGSMVKMRGREIIDVGPRSAHIANLPYAAYAPAGSLGEMEVEEFAYPGDSDAYIAVRDKASGVLYAVTLACAANASGLVREGDYAKGDKANVDRAMDALARHFGKPVEKILEIIHGKAAEKNRQVILRMIEDYELKPEQVELCGGGGGAAAVVPYLAKDLGMKYRIAKNAEVISPIGVALAMVRDVVERTIDRPTEEDIAKIRREAEEQALRSGASPETIEVFIEVDSTKNLLRAIVTGATELRTRDPLARRLEENELAAIAAESLALPSDQTRLVARTDAYAVFQGKVNRKRFFGLASKTSYPSRVLDAEGVIRLQTDDGVVISTTAEHCGDNLRIYMDKLTRYSEGGEKIPQIFILSGSRVLDFSKLMSKEQVMSLQSLEFNGVPADRPIIIVMSA